MTPAEPVTRNTCVDSSANEVVGEVVITKTTALSFTYQPRVEELAHRIQDLSLVPPANSLYHLDIEGRPGDRCDLDHRPRHWGEPGYTRCNDLRHRPGR